MKWTRIDKYAARCGRYYVERSTVMGKARYTSWYQPPRTADWVPPVMLASSDKQRVAVEAAEAHERDQVDAGRGGEFQHRSSGSSG